MKDLEQAQQYLLECVEALVTHARSRKEDSVPAIELMIAIESLVEAKVAAMLRPLTGEEP